LLDRVEERLLAAGIRRSAAPSKLSRALGGRRPAPVPEPPAAGPESTAGEAATAYLGAQRAAVLALDPAVRRAEPDAVHRMRVATRRARSALKSFGRELAREATDPLGAELKWLAAVLGGERDREVLAERLARRVADLDPAFVGPELLARLGLPPAGTTARPTAPSSDRSSTLSSARSQAHAAVLATLDGARYFALLDALDALLAEPPYLPGAAAPARTAVAAAVRRDHRRLGAAVESALALPPGEERDIALHEARKDAKRARYSGEAAQPVLGEPAAAHTARMKAVQQLLGEHQDSVMCRTALAALRAEAEAAGEDPAPYEAIDRAERQAAARVEERLPGVWAAAGHSV
jgi:CHAD domain-containing protein